MPPSTTDFSSIAEQYRLLDAMIATGAPPRELEGDGWLAKADTLGVFSEIRIVPRGPSTRPGLRAYYIAECPMRPAPLPSHIPFLSDLSCLVILSGIGGHASWPAAQVHQPDVSKFLGDLLPPSYINLRHPRRLVPVLEQLRTRLLQISPGDPRGDKLESISRRMEERIHDVGDATSEDEWASPVDMATFWGVYETLGMPWQLALQVENGFDALTRWLAAAGWAEETTRGPLLTGPIRGCGGRVAFFRRGDEAAQIIRSATEDGYISLGMDWQADAYV